MARVDVALLPDHVRLDRLKDQTVVVVDVLRATTTIVAAIGSGAESIIPFASIDDARVYAETHPGVLLCGERGGVPPDGFCFGNSPLEYTTENVGGQQLALSTTNGTRAMSMVEDAPRIMIGSMTNRAAVCEAVGQEDLLIVCSGTDRKVSLDDAFTAGMMIHWLIEHAGCSLTENAKVVSGSAVSLLEEHQTMERVLSATAHGLRLAGLGMERDIEYASRLDSSKTVPVLDSSSNTIRVG